MERDDPETWMWERASHVLDRADRLQRYFFVLVHSDSKRAVWKPPVDVFENELEVSIVVALPGVDPRRIEVSIEDGALHVSGERTMPQLCTHADVHRIEIPRGRFARHIPLPPNTYTSIDRDYVQGCLVVRLAKSR